MDVYTVHLVVSTLADQLLTPIAMHSNVTPGGIQKVFILPTLSLKGPYEGFQTISKY